MNSRALVKRVSYSDSPIPADCCGKLPVPAVVATWARGNSDWLICAKSEQLYICLWFWNGRFQAALLEFQRLDQSGIGFGSRIAIMFR
jgi:hypothetical protein